MDGVLADFAGATDAYLQRHHPHIPIVERHTFHYHDQYPDPDHFAIISELHASQNFFRNLAPLPGALEGWAYIESLGYKPRICSAPLRANAWCYEEKLEWIKHHLGANVADTAIIDKDKARHAGIALIDDRPDIEGADQAAWQHIVFHQPYNQNVPTSFRLYGWEDPRFEELLADVHELSRVSQSSRELTHH